MDEATNFKIEGLPNALTALREYGIRCFFIFQELEEFAKTYGRPALETLLSQTECKIFFRVQSYKTSEMVSQLCGEQTVKVSNFSLGHDHQDKIQKSLSESSRRLITPDEVRRLQDSESIIFIRNLKPIKAQKVSYAEVSPWKNWVEINPLFGKRLKGKTRVWLNYFWRIFLGRPTVSKYKIIKSKHENGRPFSYALRMGLPLLRGFLSTVPILVVVVTFSLEKTPHLRTSYAYYGADSNSTYTTCRYWGKNGAVDTHGSECPLITFLKEED